VCVFFKIDVLRLPRRDFLTVRPIGGISLEVECKSSWVEFRNARPFLVQIIAGACSGFGLVFLSSDLEMGLGACYLKASGVVAFKCAGFVASISAGFGFVLKLLL
jgi:hypothetical protein